ncbi:outer membrane protein assembly factor BamD [bacterium]|nr:outer membrane protein assembly factor BamD [bacterium]
MRFGRLAPVVCAVILASACGPKFEEMSPREVYEYGETEFADKDYNDAIKAYEALIDLYPFSIYVTQAELRIADSYFRRKRWAEAAVAYEDFVDKHPTNESVAHAVHHMGVSHYKEKRAIDRDQDETWAAESALSRVVTQYPDYAEAGDAREKLAEVREDLAARERYVGRFYRRENEPYAALQRYLVVVRDYPDTKYYPEALYFAGVSLVDLEEPAEARRYLELLADKFPDHKFGKRATDVLARIP